MPVILRTKGYEFSFVMYDLDEPVHVHVRSGHKQAKFWVKSLSIAWTRGFRPSELNEITRIIAANQDYIFSIWQREDAKRR